ncbi:2977_t:CDS:2, partial [Cetraspora pellucida]
YAQVNGQAMHGSPTQHHQMRLFSSKERRKSTRSKNDPYWLCKLQKSPTEFKPKFKENPYSYVGTLPALDITNLHRVFSTSNTIRITGINNRHKSHMSVDGKRKSSFIRHWKIYGLILSGSQLMIFKDEAGFNSQMK